MIKFEDIDGGHRRVIVQDLIGGRRLREDPYDSNIKKWTWAEGAQIRLVTDNVMDTAPSTAEGINLSTRFPPDGGNGMSAWAMWPWYPKEGADGDGELLFPRGAEIKEVVDVNGDWYWGVYMGQQGLVPSPYVKVLDNGPT